MILRGYDNDGWLSHDNGHQLVCIQVAGRPYVDLALQYYMVQSQVDVRPLVCQSMLITYGNILHIML